MWYYRPGLVIQFLVLQALEGNGISGTDITLHKMVLRLLLAYRPDVAGW